MPRVNFHSDAPQGFLPPPRRWHCARVDSIRETTTKAGAEDWLLRWVITRGSHAGEIVFDNIPFTEKALPKLQILCTAFGIDISGPIEITPADLIGKVCLIEVQLEHTVDSSGLPQTRRSVRFDGYKACDVGAEPGDDEPNDL